jgi:hypothetical protein
VTPPLRKQYELIKKSRGPHEGAAAFSAKIKAVPENRVTAFFIDIKEKHLTGDQKAGGAALSRPTRPPRGRGARKENAGGNRS